MALQTNLKGWQNPRWMPVSERINVVRGAPEQFANMGNAYALSNILYNQAYYPTPHLPSPSRQFNNMPVDYFAGSAHFNNYTANPHPGNVMFWHGTM